MESRNYAQVLAIRRNKYPIASFEDNLFLPFEGTEMPIPVGYDAHLSTAFGDYDSSASRQAATAS